MYCVNINQILTLHILYNENSPIQYNTIQYRSRRVLKAEEISILSNSWKKADYSYMKTLKLGERVAGELTPIFDELPDASHSIAKTSDIISTNNIETFI